MATIDKIPLTNAESLNLLQGTSTTPFQLTDYADGATALSLAGGRTEEIGGYLYAVNDGDYAISETGVTDDTQYYVLVKDDGTGSADAYLSTKGGTFDPNKGGYYVNDATADDGAKVIASAYRGTATWEQKSRVVNVEAAKGSFTQGVKTGTYFLRQEIIDMPAVNMNADFALQSLPPTYLEHLTIDDIVDVSGVIWNDNRTVMYSISAVGLTPLINFLEAPYGIDLTWSSTSIFATSANFKSTSISRGKFYITYIQR